MPLSWAGYLALALARGERLHVLLGCVVRYYCGLTWRLSCFSEIAKYDNLVRDL